MPRALLFRILMMVVLLVAVLFSIRRINNGAVQKAFEALGLQAGSGDAAGLHPSAKLGPGEKAYNFCPTRIHSVVWNERRKVEEFRDGMRLKWIAVDPSPREIGYMEMEKWLAAHCQLAVKPLEGATAAGFAPFISVRYIDGTELKIERAGEDRFRVLSATPEAFESSDLKTALEQLEKIAEFRTPTESAGGAASKPSK